MALGNKMQSNGQCQQAGQLQFTHPHPSYNTNRSNRGYENNTSYIGVGALVGHYTMHSVEVKPQSTQRQNKSLTLNNHLSASSYQDCSNSAQNASNQSNTPPVNLNQPTNQVMFAQKTSMSGNPQSAVLNRNVLYYQSQVLLHKSLNQSQIPRMENVSVPLTNPTTSSTMQRICHTQQSAVQSPMYSQTSQQAALAPCMSPSYTQSINIAFSNVPTAQNAQIYTVTPCTLLSTFCDNKVVANDQSAQNNNLVSQTNDSRAMHSVNGCTPLSNVLAANVYSQSSSLIAAMVQAQHPPYPSQKHVQQTSVRGSVNMQTAQSAKLATNDNHCLNTSLTLLPSQTCLQKDVSAQSHLQNMRAAPQQTTMSSKEHSVNQCDNSLFYHKINDVSNTVNLCAPLNQASESSKCDTFAQIDPASSAQAKDCLLQVSPGRATRAVAVVLPLSQENSPIKHSSPSSLSSSNPASGSSFTSSNKLDKAPVKTPDTSFLSNWHLQKSTSSSNSSADKGDAQATSPQNPVQLNAQDAGPKLSTLPLTFSQLVEGNCSTKLSRRQKSNSGTRKTPTRQKLCEEELSSVPTTEWTLKMLYEKILELESKENEHKKSENKHDKNHSAVQIVHLFWNGDYKAMFNAAKNGGLSKEMASIRHYCHNIDVDSVILSQNQSKHPSRYQVLQHDEVYEEKNSYASFWLNINQLDDIDKEFGLPYFLTYGIEGHKSIDAELKSKLEDTCQTEVKPAISRPDELLNKEDQSKLICDRPSENNNTESETRYTFSHEDPDAEKRAEKNNCVSNAQSNESSYSFKIEVLPPEEAKVIFDQVDCDSPQTVASAVSQEIPPNDQNQTFNVTTLEKICCIEKWKEKVFGLSAESKCKCEKHNQNEEKLVPSESTSCHVGTVDLTDDDDDIPLFIQESENIQEYKNRNKSTITISSEGADESQVSENSCATHTDHQQDLFISTESQQDVGTNKNRFENGFKATKTANSASSHPVNASIEVKEDIKRLASGNPDRSLCPFKKNKLSSHLKSQTILESFSKCKNSGRVETVELALFGSKHKKCASSSNLQSHLQPLHTHTLPEKTEEAPRRIFVKFSPLKISDKQEAKPSDNISVKTRLHENWRNSFPLTTIRLRRKNKKFAIVCANHGTTTRLSHSEHKDKRVSAKRKIRDCDDGQGCKKKRSCSDGSAVNILKKPADGEVRPLQENALKFNVLPNTFSFKEGSNDRDSTTDSKADEKTVPVPADGNPSIVKTKGAWCDESTSKTSPQSPASVPESVGLFQEFQRRYKMRQASTDE